MAISHAVSLYPLASVSDDYTVCPMHNYTSDHQSSVFKQSLLACVVYLPDVDGLVAIKGLSVTAVVHNILSIVVACIMDIHCLLLDFTASSFQTHFI